MPTLHRRGLTRLGEALAHLGLLSSPIRGRRLPTLVHFRTSIINALVFRPQTLQTIPLCGVRLFVLVDESALAAMPNIKLDPDMPATVMIPTVQCTALDYIVGPLVMSFNHSFRQR